MFRFWWWNRMRHMSYRLIREYEFMVRWFFIAHFLVWFNLHRHSINILSMGCHYSDCCYLTLALCPSRCACEIWDMAHLCHIDRLTILGALVFYRLVEVMCVKYGHTLLYILYVSDERIKIIYVSIEHQTLGSDKIITKDRSTAICSDGYNRIRNRKVRCDSKHGVCR